MLAYKENLKLSSRNDIMKSPGNLWLRYNYKTENFMFIIYACIMPFFGGNGSALKVSHFLQACLWDQTAPLPWPDQNLTLRSTPF